ncbi:A disintegrin and metalloproteinase with thrombospondin motifs like isoform X2 [Eupeodes corollae]|uniref:A disintegrin and metalloproteinase with thrombospondin motifs like isoform X2 n=1 Tax=Eupeodes corollae TaxID=290404 RepID=UPI0024932C38|nr:A disintegrin and metalloproteinase with thrombospondin motifs like isoform X2 [Eupeodes corollae]
MTQITGLILTLWSIYSTCIAMPDVHTKMSPEQLQSVFHVEDIASVPNYELVQLEHLGTEHNGELLFRRRRSVDNNMFGGAQNGKEAHHVKKDLSKSPYYSELKLQAHQSDGGGASANSISDQSYSEKLKNLDLSGIKEHNVSLSAFGEVLNLTLRPTDGLFKNGPESLRMFTIRSEPNATHGLALEEVQNEDKSLSAEEVGQVFQDEENMAAILMRRHLQSGDLVMEGSIGHEMVIKPLPDELNTDQDKPHHVIFKREAQPLEHMSDFAFMEPDDIETSEKQKSSSAAAASASHSNSKRTKRFAGGRFRRTQQQQYSSRVKREAPYMIYPEILVIVDYDGYRLHGGDNLQVKRYFISFWNGVDLRYRLLKGPRIRISIAGIIISRGRDATPYLERNRVGRDAIDSAAALTDMGKYLFRERRLPVYDIAVAITKLDMCRRATPYGECKRGTAGFAYVGGACVVNKRLEKVNSVAIIEDTGGFSGIIVAAHEVGHLLGAVHDGSPPPSYLGGPGAERCRWEDGYIMSDLRHTERGFRWSPCTVQSFHHFLNGDTASCLHNAPHEDSALGRSLPGTLLSLDAQCRRDRGTYACFKDERVCAQLFCFDAQTGYCVAYRPAAEGSSCGNGVHCLDGRCTPLPANVIQDYSNQYRAVYNSTTTTTMATPSSQTSTPTQLQGGSEDFTSSAEIDSNETLDEQQHHRTSTQRSYILGGRSTTRSSLFDTYFRKRPNGNGSSTKYLSQLQPQASPPAYTTNYLGDNTNNLPINIPRERSSRSGRSTIGVANANVM